MGMVFGVAACALLLGGVLYARRKRARRRARRERPDLINLTGRVADAGATSLDPDAAAPKA